jgi:hypothetical protein
MNRLSGYYRHKVLDYSVSYGSTVPDKLRDIKFRMTLGRSLDAVFGNLNTSKDIKD